jgi:hypothetical protein
VKRPLALLPFLLLACAHSRLTAGAEPLSVGVLNSQVTVSAEADKDAGEVARIARLAGEALPRVQRWGGLPAPTRIVIVPDHATLEERAHRPGFGWLRAWARYDVIYLQSPSTWRFLFQPGERELRQVLTHELTHCAMYQVVSSAHHWNRIVIPLWFREGMASWTAQQSEKRYPVADLHRFLAEHPDLDPLREADDMVRDNPGLVYSAAHWAFDQLENRGNDEVPALLGHLREGSTFPQAFAEVFGESEDDFEDQVLNAWRSYPAKPASADSRSSRPRRL